MKVTTKGQITIPHNIHERFGIYPGSEMDVVIEGNAVKIVQTKIVPRLRRSTAARLRGKGSVAMSTDEIMALTRGKTS